MTKRLSKTIGSVSDAEFNSTYYTKSGEGIAQVEEIYVDDEEEIVYITNMARTIELNIDVQAWHTIPTYCHSTTISLSNVKVNPVFYAKYGKDLNTVIADLQAQITALIQAQTE